MRAGGGSGIELRRPGRRAARAGRPRRCRGDRSARRTQAAASPRARDADAWRRFVGRGRRTLGVRQDLAERGRLAARKGAVRYLAAPGGAQSLLRPAPPAAGPAGGEPARAGRPGATPGRGDRRERRRRSRGWRASGAGAPAAGGDRFDLLSGAVERRSGGDHGDQRRGAGKPAVSRAAVAARAADGGPT